VITQRISIIIPAYNEERHLADCLDSVVAQTSLPDEVVVVDNNSTDQTVAIAARYPFVKLIREPKQGIVYARDAGFNAATGTILARTDADVVLPPDWVARLHAFYADPAHAEHGLSGGGRPSNLRWSRLMGWLQGQVAFRINRFLLGHYIFFGSNMAIPAKLWPELRDQMCNRTDIHEDLDLAIHFHRAGYPITYHETLQVVSRWARVITHREHLLANLMMWPQTLRVHGKRTWIFGLMGALLLYCLWPVPVMSEKIARRFGKKPVEY
jgi:hypothetical protein